MVDMKKIALFAAGTLFGSAGFKLLSSSDAKKAYTQTAAAVLRMKDCTMETVSKVQEQASDILEGAKASTRPALPRLRPRSSRTRLRLLPPRPTSDLTASEPPAGGSFSWLFLQYAEDIQI